jgi:hypothetical protein
MVAIESKLLGCEVALVEDERERKEALESGVHLVIYSRDEVERMRGLPPDELLAIHELKREVGGLYAGPSDTQWPAREVPAQESLFDITERKAFAGGWGDEVMVRIGKAWLPGTVVNVWDNEYTASHVTVELDAGGKVTLHASEVSPCATAA